MMMDMWRRRWFSVIGVVLAVACSATGQQGVTCTEGLAADPNNCEAFLQCVGGTYVRLMCPANLRFNPATSQCDWPSKVPCDNNAPRSTFSQPRQQSMQRPIQRPMQQQSMQQPMQQEQPMQQPMQQQPMQQPMQQQPMQQPMQQHAQQPMQNMHQRTQKMQQIQQGSWKTHHSPMNQGLGMVNTGLMGGMGMPMNGGLMNGGVGMEMRSMNTKGSGMMGSGVTLFPPFLNIPSKKKSFNMGMVNGVMNNGLMNGGMWNGMMNGGMMNGMLNGGMMNGMLNGGMMNGMMGKGNSQKKSNSQMSPILIPYPMPPEWFGGKKTTTASPTSSTTNATTTTTSKKKGNNIFFISMVPPMVPVDPLLPPCALTSSCPGMPLCNETRSSNCVNPTLSNLLFRSGNTRTSFQGATSISRSAGLRVGAGLGGLSGFNTLNSLSGLPGLNGLTSILQPTGSTGQGQGQNCRAVRSGRVEIPITALGSSRSWTTEECLAMETLLNAVITTSAENRSNQASQGRQVTQRTACTVTVPNVAVRCA
ncbi:uncharacterized protein [Haliotis asinina]|uniref:uncharacterized protein n=1 Tax=Haliotis asinina TaxID=109174 RepID=UPI0035318F48